MKQITITEQLNGDYFTFYDNDLGSILRTFQGFEFATVQVSIDDVSGPYGSVYVNAKHGKRLCTIIGDLVGSDIFSNRRLLLKALRLTGTLKLIKFTTYDDIDLQFEAEITKYQDPYTHQIHTYNIEFTAPDWRFYSQTLKSSDIGQTIIRGGSKIPANVPMKIQKDTSAASSLMNILENEGNESSDPIFTITGPGTNFTITNATSGLSFVMNTTLIAGDVVIVDVRARTVVKNGITNLYPNISGDFWSLLPGENEIDFLIDSGSTTNTNLNLQFRDAYNGI